MELDFIEEEIREELKMIILKVVGKDKPQLCGFIEDFMRAAFLHGKVVATQELRQLLEKSKL